MPATKVRLTVRILATVALLVAGCSSGEPALPAADPSAVHDRLVGSEGSSFLAEISTYDWPDDGASAGALFGWIARDALSSDPAASSRAGESARQVASYLADHRADLLNISTGMFGSKHVSVGALNPKLVLAYSDALIPYQGALACYYGDSRGFQPLDAECHAAASRAVNAVTVLNTEPTAATNFANAAYERMDDYVARFADGIVDPALHFSRGPATAGRLLGIIRLASGSGVDVPTPLQEMTQANYLIGAKMVANEPNSGIPAQYFVGGRLMSPTEISSALGGGAVAGYNDSLSTYLTTHGNVEFFISHDFYDAYQDIVGSNGGGSK